MFSKTSLNLSIYIFLFFSFILLESCHKVPVTNRKQVVLLPESELVAMSLTSYDEFITTHKISTQIEQSAMVKKVGNDIANAVISYLKSHNNEKLIEGYQWEYNLVEDNEPNAWCMPGGKIVVYTGILPYTKDANGLAVVMGHEVAHAVARHGNERMSHQVVMQYGSAALSSFLSEKSETTQAIYQQAFGLGAQLGVMLPYSRLHETEADKMGLIFMAIAGYNPESAIEFWQRMSTNGGQKPLELMSTHPSDDYRIQTLKEFMPEVLKYYKPIKP
jgi:predicted Zn-dependent protease